MEAGEWHPEKKAVACAVSVSAPDDEPSEILLNLVASFSHLCEADGVKGKGPIRSGFTVKSLTIGCISSLGRRCKATEQLGDASSDPRRADSLSQLFNSQAVDWIPCASLNRRCAEAFEPMILVDSKHMTCLVAAPIFCDEGKTRRHTVSYRWIQMKNSTEFTWKKVIVKMIWSFSFKS